MSDTILYDQSFVIPLITYLDIHTLLNCRLVNKYFNRSIYNYASFETYIKNAEHGRKLMGIFKRAKLKIINSYRFNNEEVKGLINITSLDLSYNNTITDEGVKWLVNLTSLNLDHNKTVTDDGVKGLINLTSLDLQFNNVITDEGVKGLINLTSL